ncbi:MAG: ATP-binding protein [Thermoplasmatota archaeon]
MFIALRPSAQGGEGVTAVGQLVGGEHGSLVLRQRSESALELGELLVAPVGAEGEEFVLLQVFDLLYGSQLESRVLEMMSGMRLEGYGEGADFLDRNLRSYVLARARALVHVRRGDGGWVVRMPKVLPPFFSEVFTAGPEHLAFLGRPGNPVLLGRVRSGSRVLGVDVFLDGRELFSHHVLVPATTGRGKSNLVKVMLWSVIGRSYCGVLILDSHDEYYGRSGPGLKDHPGAQKGLVYYSPSPPRGALSLRLNLSLLRPWHFRGIVPLTDAQYEAMRAFYNRHGEHWISALMQTPEEEALERLRVQPITASTLKRRLELVLGIFVTPEGYLRSRSRVFVPDGGESTVEDIARHLEEGRKVLLDTSRLTDQAELILGSIVASEVLERRKSRTAEGAREGPVVSIVIEEAPRVLHGGEESNVFGTIAREGRKFGVGLVAVTQLASMIPREILANLNTKIILGNEMRAERDAIIGSASQDLSSDSQMIASLDKGEAIVSSVFTKFAIPIQIPLFESLVDEARRSGGGPGGAEGGRGRGGEAERVTVVG